MRSFTASPKAKISASKGICTLDNMTDSNSSDSKNAICYMDLIFKISTAISLVFTLRSSRLDNSSMVKDLWLVCGGGGSGSGDGGTRDRFPPPATHTYT